MSQGQRSQESSSQDQGVKNQSEGHGEGRKSLVIVGQGQGVRNQSEGHDEGRKNLVIVDQGQGVRDQCEGHNESRKSLVILGPARTEDVGITEAEVTTIDKTLLTELTPVPPSPRPR